uniref:Uncharacterized protein n=1 Tax=Tanacetum cinerariifolium TaxID=118510 RepID=A0A6L2KM51_TANCI|nr:hypothetical protein [Tanacetum cinerariifolium]
MTDKIDTVLKAINDEIMEALPSDMVKNPKLNVNSTSLVLSAHSYPMEDPQRSCHPFNSINAIKTCSSQASNLQKDQLQMVNKIRISKPKEPAKDFKDEFKDLNLNLPVLEVLAHALMYNAILDKYVESLELGKNRSAFIQGKMPDKMKDTGLFALPYMDKVPVTLLLISRGFLATANTIIDCKKAKIAVGEGVTRVIFRVKEINLGEEDDGKIVKSYTNKSYGKYVGVRRSDRKYDRLEQATKRGDEAWHAKIRLIDPDGEEFTKTFQSIPTTRKFFEKENPSEVINLDHFHDS